MSEVTDSELFARIRLSKPELEEMQARFQDFVKSLNPDEKQSLRKSILSTEEAAQTLGPDVTPERLERFLRAYAPTGATILLSNGLGGIG
jgi:hypothetical protein